MWIESSITCRLSGRKSSPWEFGVELDQIEAIELANLGQVAVADRKQPQHLATVFANGRDTHRLVVGSARLGIRLDQNARANVLLLAAGHVLAPPDAWV